MLRSLLIAALAVLLRIVGWTWRVRWRGALPDGGFVVTGLHENILPLGVACRGRGFTPMISRSTDGRLAARAFALLGYPSIAGSSSRGGKQALDEGVALAKGGGRPGLAVDGPRGPRGEPKPGAAVIAARAEVPLVGLRCAVRPALRLRTWDRFCLPLPFARVAVDVICLPPPPSDAEAHVAAASAQLKRALASDAASGAAG